MKRDVLRRVLAPAYCRMISSSVLRYGKYVKRDLYIYEKKRITQNS